MKKTKRTTISISSEVLILLRNNLEYKERDGKHFIETYDDLLERLIERNKQHKE
jgi:hypothetical protein